MALLRLQIYFLEAGQNLGAPGWGSVIQGGMMLLSEADSDKTAPAERPKAPTAFG